MDEWMEEGAVPRLRNAQKPLHTFPRNFPVAGDVANLIQTCCGLASDRGQVRNKSL